MRIAYTNLLDDGALTESTENLIYPAENVQTQRLEEPWRTTTVATQTMTIDFGSAPSAINVAAIIGHNMTASAATTISGNDVDIWTAPTVAETLTATENMILKYITGGTHQFWQFALSDATVTDGYLEVGRLWLGSYLDIDPSSMDDLSVTKHRTDTVTYGRGRQKYATEGIGWRSFNLSFPATPNTMLESIQTMYDANGNHTSLIFSNFNALRTYELIEPVYCSIQGDITFRHGPGARWSYGLNLEEDR